MPTFADRVDMLCRKYQRNLLLVLKDSVQETVSLAQRVENEGGRMRVKTGFLRASLNAAFEQMPIGQSVNPTPRVDNSHEYTGGGFTATLLQWQPGQTLYVGWTANYARYREYQDGFMKGAIEQWDQTVATSVAKVRSGAG